jgi:hypothetical protein
MPVSTPTAIPDTMDAMARPISLLSAGRGLAITPLFSRARCLSMAGRHFADRWAGVWVGRGRIACRSAATLRNVGSGTRVCVNRPALPIQCASRSCSR